MCLCVCVREHEKVNISVCEKDKKGLEDKCILTNRLLGVCFVLFCFWLVGFFGSNVLPFIHSSKSILLQSLSYSEYCGRVKHSPMSFVCC